MHTELIKFIKAKNFPCIMAKAVLKSGFFTTRTIDSLQLMSHVSFVLEEIYAFIQANRLNPGRLASFILVIDNPAYDDFKLFEEAFWPFLKQLNRLDKSLYGHDPRVDSNPESDRFSFSLKEEAFFILALHPQSPRLARRFFKPAIVFNFHQQFEEMRQKGIFKTVRNAIRKRDKDLQGFINPMLTDFGDKSEVFQYLGKVYEQNAACPLN